LIRNLVTDAILHESIKTTKQKAKLTARVLDRLIARSKNENKMQAIRYIMKYVFSKQASMKLIDDLSKRYKDRPSGFSRIVKL
jgi:large subunit ribosomal protein L17